MFCVCMALMISGTVTPRLASCVRIHPDAHGILAGAEYLTLRHARQARQRVIQVDVGVVGQEICCRKFPWARRAPAASTATRGLLHRHAGIDHLRRATGGRLVARICARIWSVLASCPKSKSTVSVMPPLLALMEYM